jgi:hypothetical protein
MSLFDLKTFNHNLLITQQYCELHLLELENYSAEILRSINPVFNSEPFFKYENIKVSDQFEKSVIWSIDPYDYEKDNSSIYSKLFLHQLEYKKKSIQHINEHKIYNGEVLIFEIDGTLIDGDDNAYSKGFYDDYNCPPIDTWFYLSSNSKVRLLFCWIPHQVIGLADEGIFVNPENCFDWMKVWFKKEYNSIKSLNKFKLHNVILDKESGLLK